jgi:hypothetical protein
MQILNSMTVRTVLLGLLLSCFSATSAQSQTVGNGTVFAPPAGAREAYGINAGAETTTGEFASTHHHRGNETGIGGSTIGTTSPTSESSPAVLRPSFIPNTVQQFHLPKLDSAYSPQSEMSTALQMFSPALPSMPRSSALTDPLSNPFTKPNTFQPIENLPSFSTRRSVTDLLRFR